MSTPCTTCGEPLADDALRCPACGALASPQTDETPTGETRLDDAPPWSIPIREPAVEPAGEARPGRGRAVALASLAVLALVLAVALGSRLLGDDGSDTASRDPGTDEVASPAPAGIDADDVTTTTTAPTTTVAPTTTQTSEPEAASAPTTTAAPATTTTVAMAMRTAPNGTGSVPALSTSFRGWLAQLKSVPYAAGTDGLAEEWQRTRAVAPDAVALRSDDWSGLGDGFWVLVEPGPFSSADDVRSFCASAGLEGDDACLPRELRG